MGRGGSEIKTQTVLAKMYMMYYKLGSFSLSRTYKGCLKNLPKWPVAKLHKQMLPEPMTTS